MALIVASIVANAFGIQYIDYGNGDGYSIYSTGASAAYVCWFILLLAYHPTCWWAFQGTIGQRAMGLRVVKAADGSSLGIGATTIRYIVWLVCQVTVVLAIIAAVIANDNPRKQTWWDDVCGSVVVRRV